MAEEFEDPTSRYQNPRYSGKGVPDRSKNRSIDHSSSEALMALHAYKLRTIQGWADSKGIPMKHRLKGIEDALKLEYPKEKGK